VAYPVGGLTEAVLPGVTGWICSEATPRALAAALRDVGALGRGELRRAGQAARDWVEEQFDWGRIAAQTEAVYLRALRGDGIRAGRDGTNDEAGECRSRGEAPLRGR